jgi:hypothetical protein
MDKKKTATAIDRIMFSSHDYCLKFCDALYMLERWHPKAQHIEVRASNVR